MKTYDRFVEVMQKIADVESAIGIMSWDKEVNLPTKGASFRSRQVATLSGMAHEMFIGPELGELLHILEDADGLNEVQKRNISRTKKDYLKANKYPKEFVVKGSKLISSAYQSWLKARQQNDFNVYKKDLGALIDHKKEEAELLGYEDHPYDALIDLYEPETKSAELTVLFDGVKTELLDIVQKIRQQPPVEDSFLHKHYDRNKQWEFGLYILEKVGYDFDRGRQDISPHPFTIHFNPNDVRVTTRIDEKNFTSMTWSCIHEGGHALYEQGMNPDQYGLPCGRAISLGIHESQSRLWENNVGRSIHFWKSYYPELQSRFAENLRGIELEQFYNAINTIQPNLIRTEADELHYHFHVMIRFEIEKAMMEGSIHTEDLLSTWNDLYEQYLGMRPGNDNEGILQDIHWAHGSIGYFPTYSLGSLYAAQFFAQANKEIPGLNVQIEKGNTTQLLSWLRDKIHRHGQYFTAEELCEEITGEKLNFRYFKEYVANKYGNIYNIDLN